MAEALTLLLRNWKLILTGAVFLSLVVALLIAKADARYWQKRQEATQAAFDRTVADYHAAAAQARADDLANAERVKTEQQQITQEVSDEYEARLADAEHRADALKLHANAKADPGSGGTAQLPALPVPAGQADAAAEDGFSIEDRLLATKQAIQLDELISWVEAQARVDVQGVQ